MTIFVCDYHRFIWNTAVSAKDNAWDFFQSCSLIVCASSLVCGPIVAILVDKWMLADVGWKATQNIEKKVKTASAKWKKIEDETYPGKDQEIDETIVANNGKRYKALKYRVPSQVFLRSSTA